MKRSEFETKLRDILIEECQTLQEKKDVMSLSYEQLLNECFSEENQYYDFRTIEASLNEQLQEIKSNNVNNEPQHLFNESELKDYLLTQCQTLQEKKCVMEMTYEQLLNECFVEEGEYYDFNHIEQLLEQQMIEDEEPLQEGNIGRDLVEAPFNFIKKRPKTALLLATTGAVVANKALKRNNKYREKEKRLARAISDANNDI